jgi:hypothetical protein
MAKVLGGFKSKEYNYILAVLLALFIIFPVQLPDIVNEMVSSVAGKIVVIVITLNLFLINPVVGTLGLVAAFELLKRASNTPLSLPMNRFIPSELVKSTNLNKFNQFPVTLEEVVISKQLPHVFNRTATGKSPYKPIQDPLQGAARL